MSLNTVSHYGQKISVAFPKDTSVSEPMAKKAKTERLVIKDTKG